MAAQRTRLTGAKPRDQTIFMEAMTAWELDEPIPLLFPLTALKSDAVSLATPTSVQHVFFTRIIVTARTTFIEANAAGIFVRAPTALSSGSSTLLAIFETQNRSGVAILVDFPTIWDVEERHDVQIYPPQNVIRIRSVPMIFEV